MSLAGRVALVTGGARGIGEGICDLLLSENAKVCVADILEAEGEETLKNFEAKYGKENVIFHKLNVVDEQEFESVVTKTKQHFGHLDILCNNAGVNNELTPKRLVDINLMGVVNGIQMAHKHLKNSKGEKGGTVINTASILGIHPTYAVPTYSATKVAVVSLTRTWGNEKNVEITKVKVNAICPDATNTPLMGSPHNSLHDEPFNELVQSYQGRWLQPSDIANGVLRILNDNVTGAVLLVSKVIGVDYKVAEDKDFIDLMSNI